MPFALGLISLVLLVYALLDIVTTPRDAVRTLPKPLWLLVVLPPVFGPVAWFLAGRPPRRSKAAPKPAVERRAPDDDEEFLRELRRRADEQRRRAQDPRDD